MKNIFCTPILILAFQFSYAQSAYWQQEVNYEIDVRLDDVKHELHGFIQIEYINHSPAALDYIWFHLWPNAYKNENTAFAKQQVENGSTDFYFSKPEARGYIDELAFAAEGQALKWEYDSANIDIAKVFLNRKLSSGDKIKITTPFHVKIPSDFSRLGHVGQSYQITQWYPKPAVYDKYGWHPIPYLDQGEFYSEYGKFDVRITLPKNYVVGATGNLINFEEQEWLNQIAERTAAAEEPFLTEEFSPSDTTEKTIEFIANNVHDFGWFADKRYHVMKSSVELPFSKRVVTTWAMFTSKQFPLWKKAAQYVNDAVYHYSLWVGEYPYDQCAAVQGALSAGGGMEYPNVTVISAGGSDLTLQDIVIHEVGHNWFYGQLGSNERINPWMDEGINSYYEMRTMKTLHPDAKIMGDFAEKGIAKFLDLDYQRREYLNKIGFLIKATTNEDQPPGLASEEFTSTNYGTDVYLKTALAFDYLAHYLGQENFDKIMQEYYQQFEFKHPQPEDIRGIFEVQTGKNLDWFFDDLIYSKKKLDYKILSSDSKKYLGDELTEFEIKNTGDIAAPFSISVIQDDAVYATYWVEGFYGEKTITIPSCHVCVYQINAEFYTPEINEKNNSIRARGILKRWEPIRVQPYFSLQNPERSQLFIYPKLGWNNYDRWLFGLILYNHSVPFKKFNYSLLPMYSFASRNLNGVGVVEYNMYPQILFQNVKLSLSGFMFSEDENHSIAEITPCLVGECPEVPGSAMLQFRKVTPAISFEFKKQRARNPQENVLKFRQINVKKEYVGLDIYFELAVLETYYYINELSFSSQNHRTINPFGWSLKLEQFNQFVKASAEGNYHFNYNSKNSGFDIRLFAGAILNENKNDFNFPLNLNGGSGLTDYKYDDIYLGRTEQTGILSQQITLREGGFKLANNTHPWIGMSDQWMASVNLRSSIPFLKLPIGLYFDYGIYMENKFVGNYYVNKLYNAGVVLTVWKNVFEVYIPFAWSKDYDQILKTNGDFRNDISFMIRLNQLNPEEMLKTAL